MSPQRLGSEQAARPLHVGRIVEAEGGDRLRSFREGGAVGLVRLVFALKAPSAAAQAAARVPVPVEPHHRLLHSFESTERQRLPHGATLLHAEFSEYRSFGKEPFTASGFGMSLRPFSSLAWGPTIAMSWLWGLGFFYSIHLLLTYGWLGFTAFALPNAFGLFLFGAVLDRRAPDLASVGRRVRTRFAGSFLVYQAAAVAITLFGFGICVLRPLFGPDSVGAVALVLLAACAVGHVASIAGLRRYHGAALGTALLGGAALTARLWGTSTAPLPGPESLLDDRFLGLVVPTLVGLLLGPWLDIQQWRRAVAIREAGGSTTLAFGAGAGIFLLLLVVNATLAAAAGPAGGHAGIDGVPFAGVAVAVALRGLEGGTGAWSLLFAGWAALVLSTTIDSFYESTRWLLRDLVSRSQSPLLALIPAGLVATPLWWALLAFAGTLAAAKADLPFIFMVMPWATVFLPAAAGIVAETVSGRTAYDPTLSAMLGVCALLLFAAGHVAGSAPLMTFAALVPLLATATAFRPGGASEGTTASVPLETAAPAAPAAPVSIASVPVAANADSPFQGLVDGWFATRLVATYDDTNSVGNVYFATYVRWVGKARELLFRECVPDFDLKTTTFLALTRRFEHDFKREAAEFEEIEIRIRLSKYNRKFATLSHEIHSRSHGLLGSGSQIVLFVDRETYRPIDIPPNVLRGFMPYAVAPTGKVPAFVTEGAAKAA